MADSLGSMSNNSKPNVGVEGFFNLSILFFMYTYTNHLIYNKTSTLCCQNTNFGILLSHKNIGGIALDGQKNIRK